MAYTDYDKKLAYHLHWTRAKRLRHRLAGLCIDCKQPVAPDRRQCPYHLQKEAAESRQRTAARRAANPQHCLLCRRPIVGARNSQKTYCSNAHRLYASMIRKRA